MDPTEQETAIDYSIRNILPNEGVVPDNLDDYLVNPKKHRSLLFQCVKIAFKDKCTNNYIHFDNRRYLSNENLTMKTIFTIIKLPLFQYDNPKCDEYINQQCQQRENIY